MQGPEAVGPENPLPLSDESRMRVKEIKPTPRDSQKEERVSSQQSVSISSDRHWHGSYSRKGDSGAVQPAVGPNPSSGT